MANEHHVFVYEENGSLRVAPGRLVAGRNDKIWFHTSLDSVWCFFGDSPFEGLRDAGRFQFHKEDPHAETVDADKKILGVYAYAAFATRKNPPLRGFAKGGSDPEILIYG